MSKLSIHLLLNTFIKFRDDTLSGLWYIYSPAKIILTDILLKKKFPNRDNNSEFEWLLEHFAAIAKPTCRRGQFCLGVSHTIILYGCVLIWTWRWSNWTIKHPSKQNIYVYCSCQIELMTSECRASPPPPHQKTIICRPKQSYIIDNEYTDDIMMKWYIIDSHSSNPMRTFVIKLLVSSIYKIVPPLLNQIHYWITYMDYRYRLLSSVLPICLFHHVCILQDVLYWWNPPPPPAWNDYADLVILIV